jgi:hypothetical protein
MNREAEMTTACMATTKETAEEAAATARTAGEAAADTSTAMTRGGTMGVATLDSRKTITTIHIAAITEVAGSRGADRTAAAVAASSGHADHRKKAFNSQTIL